MCQHNLPINIYCADGGAVAVEESRHFPTIMPPVTANRGRRHSKKKQTSKKFSGKKNTARATEAKYNQLLAKLDRKTVDNHRTNCTKKTPTFFMGSPVLRRVLRRTLHHIPPSPRIYGAAFSFFDR